MSLYKKLIENISVALNLSLYEMARMTPVRTIDRKLWLTVASACSRNRRTEAEDVKPVGNDKDNLVLRYVAALLIMKKPCPQTVQEIEELKTFKLVANKAFLLGATLEDIQKLYALNSRTAPAQIKPQSKPVEQLKPVEQPKRSSSLFDDGDEDFFDDGSDTGLVDMIRGFDPNTKIDVVLSNLLELDKPRGFKIYKPGKLTEFESAVFIDENPDHSKYVKDFKKLLETHNWTFYKIPTIMYSPIRDYEDMTRDLFLSSTGSQTAFSYFDSWLQSWNTFYNKLTDKFDKKFFANKRIKKAYISPDRGMIYYIERMPKNANNKIYYNHVLTFTGETNYNALMSSDFTSKIAVLNAKLKRRALQAQTKINNECLSSYKFFLKKTVHINFNWRYLIYNNRPICIASTDQAGLKKQEEWFKTYFGNPTTKCSDPNGIMEFIYKKAPAEGDYVRTLFRDNTDLKYPPSGNLKYIMITYLTEEGIQAFNKYTGGRYESLQN